MKRALVIIGSLAGAVGAIVIAGAVLLLGTERGARTAIARLAPYGVTIEQVDGHLLGPLLLQGIEYRSESAHVSLERLELNWTPRQILRRTLHVREIDATGLRVSLLDDKPDSEPPEPRAPLEDLELPIRLLFDQARATDIAITSAGADSPFHIDEIAITARAVTSQLVLSRLHVGSPELQLTARGTLTTTGDYPLALDMEWSGALPDLQPLRGSGTVRGSLADLRVSHQLDAPVVAELTARARDLVGDPHWQVEATIPTFDLASVRDDLPAHELQLRLVASGDLDSAHAEATFAGLFEEIGDFAGDLRLAYADRSVAIDHLALHLPTTRGEVVLRGNISLAGERPHADLDGRWARLTWPLEGESTFTSPAGTFRLDGDAELFRVAVDATAGPAASPPGRWLLTGEGTSTGFELRRFRGELGDGHVEVAGSFAWAPGSLETIDGQLRFAGQHEQIGPASGTVGLQYTTSALRIPSLMLQVPGGDARLRGSGELLLDTETPRFSLVADWENLAWPLQPDSSYADGPRYTSPSGEVEIVGDVERYNVTLAATVAGAAVPAGSWEIMGVGTPSRFALERLYGETLDGRVVGQGDIGWDPAFSWELVTTAEDLNPGAFVDSLPGLLSAEIVTGGAREDGELGGSLQLVRLDGQLRDEPFAASANVEIVGETLRLDTLFVRAGTAELQAGGDVGETWDMAWRLEAPDLSTVYADAAGRLSAAGTVNGARSTPLVRLELTADSLALREPLQPVAELLADADPPGPPLEAARSDQQPARSDQTLEQSGREPEQRGPEVRRAENRVESLRAEMTIDLSDQIASSLNVAATGLAAGGFLIEEARALGTGDRRDHELTLTAQTGEDAIDITLRGGLTDQQWDGAIDRFDVSGVLAGAWGMAAPSPLRLTASSIGLEPLCWVGSEARTDTPQAPSNDAEICVDGGWTRDGGGRGGLSIERLPLALFAPLLPPDATLDGYLSLSAEGEIDATGQLRGNALVDAGPGALGYRMPGGGAAERVFESLHARVLAARDTISADLTFQLEDGSGLDGAFTLPRSGAAGSRPVRGHLTGELHDDGLLGALLSDVAETAGVLRIDVDLVGTAAQPSVTGTIALEDVAADLPVQGLQLRDVDFRADANGTPTWTLSGGATSGEGRITLDGTARVPSTGTDWGAEVHATGEDFVAFQTSLAHVVISPDLTLRASPGRTEVSGEVRVPRSTITPRDLTGTVLASPDVVVIDDVAAVASANLGLYTNVRVVLGDAVHFDGLGLTGRLAGNVVVIDEPGRLTTGRGELRVLDGEYTAYRQTLSIERGRLIFGDGPVEDPGLDMRVVRQAGDVLAGMNVRGTLNEPEVTLFSEPEAQDRDILCYLMVGRRCTGGEGGPLLDTRDAAKSLGLAGGNVLAGRVGQRLGFEEARIESDDGFEEAALFLGTHLSPRLYVAYGIGLFDAALNTIRLRYTLADGWALRAESGQASGADLLYTIEP